METEAAVAALDSVEAQAHPVTAIRFLVDWPAPARAAWVVLARSTDLDGDRFETLTPAAEALAAEHPLAATLMRRAMIEDTLRGV
jgi:hypothetical protein